MGEKKAVKSIPIQFEQIQEIDSRFKRFKIWIVNVGKNYNGSIFTKEAIEKALPSIVNTPILGYIHENRLGEKDFAGHETELVIVDGEYKFRYLGNAYGVIPADCNPKFELRENEFGGIEEYLTVEAIMWTKFSDATELMDKYSIKNQSMELHDEYSGHFNDDGYFVFEDFKFYGSCILGEGVDPAVPRSTIEQMFSKHNFQKEIDKQMSDYRHLFEKHLQFKEVNNEMEETVKVDMTEEVILEEEVVSTEMEVEATEEVKEVEFAEKDEDEDDKSDDSNDDKNDDTDDKDDTDDEDEDDKKAFSNMESKLSEYESKVSELESEIQRLNNQVASLESEKVELEQFKANVNKAQHEAKAEELFAQFGKLDASDYADIKENIHEYSVEEIEGKLFERLGRKMANFTTKTKVEEKVVLKVQNDEVATKSGYGHLFTKHGIK